ncbi:hypothetical protein IGI04_041893 [Brassica rapa subsp. trilocularis]|uniref:Anaphase-promoting complex subunit 4 WD40 domain-containing protein n=1 Tax=Brassica rapa subsp. trilocularis TaxID=1813537 RepID=A0ABQ7KSM2_BRACM|nr:hypothetical protein IGI04_041893 [Brassica rapa subsp. trilocularis]
MSHLVDPTWRLLAASGGDTVKLFDVSADSGDPCVLSYTPTPGSAVSSVKWNHTNLVVASAGDDKKISLWWINGSSLGTVPVAGKDGGDSAEECLSAISFGRKGSKFIASGGTGQIVKIWDLQKKLCVKKLRGHTSTITGVMYNCKDEHLASVSVGGDLIVHNLKTGARASELKDPHGQVLRVLDYSRSSRHLLLTAGDDGTVHLWDTTGRNPKMSWKQHSAPAAGVCFSPSDEKKIASVGMDKKLYTYDSGSKRFSSCISYEAPFSSLAFGDNGHILAAGTGNGRVVFYDVRKTPQPVTVLHAFSSSEAVTSLTWQTSKPVIVNEKNYDGEMALLGGTVDDSVIIPDPVPSTTPSDSQPAGSRGTATSTSNVPSAEQTPNRTLWPGAPPGRLHALRAIDSFNDDMRVFSPIVDVSSAEKWADSEGFNNKDHLIDNKKPFASSSKGFPYGDGNKEHTKAAFSPFGTTTPTASTKSEDSSSSALTPPESWGGDRLSDKFNQLANEKISDKFPSRLGVSSTSGGSTSGSMFPLSSLGQTNLAANVSSEFPRIRDFSSASETDKNLPSSPLFAKGISAPGNMKQSQNDVGGSNFTLQLFQRTLEGTLDSFQNSVHDDMRNLHIEILRQFHMHEMEMSKVLSSVLENQAEIMKELQLLRKENQQLRQRL